MRAIGVQSLLFDLFKAFNQIERSDEADFFYPKRPIFLKLPANKSTMFMTWFTKSGAYNAVMSIILFMSAKPTK